MKRRAALTLLGAALAGCTNRLPATDSPGDDSPTPGERLDPGETYGNGVAVEDFDARVSIATPDVSSTAHLDVAAFAGDQFLLADVTGVDADALGAFDVALDGELLGAHTYRVGGFEPTPMAFRVPTRDVETAAVVRTDEDVRWRVPDEVTAALGKRPSFRVREFETPDSVEAGEAIDVELAVENDGDRGGRFLAELGATVLSDVGEVSFDVPVGETVRKTFAVSPALATPPGDDSFRVVLDWGTGEMDATVTVEGSAETETATPTADGTPTRTPTADGTPTSR